MRIICIMNGTKRKSAVKNSISAWQGQQKDTSVAKMRRNRGLKSMNTTLEIKTSESAGITFWHCLFCWRTTKSKSTIKAHMNAEHSKEWASAQAEAKEETIGK